MISVLCPSRSRVSYVLRMIESILRNPGCDIEIMLYLNDDDPQLEEYKARIPADYYIVGPDQSTCYSWNLMAKKAKYDILFLIGDDSQIISDEWGKTVIETFDRYQDKIVMVAPKAGTLGKYKCPHFLLHRNWVDALGYFLPPQFHHHYVDLWTRDVAREIDRYVHLPNLTMEFEKNVNDEVINRYTRSWLKDRDAWLWEVTSRFKQADVDVLREYINNFK